MRAGVEREEKRFGGKVESKSGGWGWRKKQVEGVGVC